MCSCARSNWMGKGIKLALAGAVIWTGSKALAEEPAAEAVQPQPQAEAPAAEAQEYWLGIVVRPVDEALRSHLKLPADQGLVVEQLVPEGPGAKAGLAQFDVLLKIDDKAVEAPADLLDAVRQSGGEALNFTLLRGGEEQTVEVTPGARDASAAQPALGLRQPEMRRLRQWADNLDNPLGRGPLNLRSFGPGIVIAPGAAPVDIPAGYKISITRANDEPAMIRVEKGNDSWQVTENDVDQLPEEVRDTVKNMLAGPQAMPQIGGQFPNMEQRFQEMERRMQQMMEQMQRLPGQPSTPDKST